MTAREVGRAPGLVGRSAEVVALEGFFAAPGSLPAVFLLLGDAGIGKSTLWRRGVAGAEEAGYRVLRCSPTEAESQLSYAALGDLLVDTEAVIEQLPGPQRRSLEAALLVSEIDERTHDQRAVATGLLNILRALARKSPVLVAVDDVQWLDVATADALTFAARRLRDERVGLLMARRHGVGGDYGDAWARVLPVDRVIRLEVGPLSLGAVHELLKEHLGTTFARPVLHRLWRTADGNPFYALELGRAVLGTGADAHAVPADLPLPTNLNHLVGARLSELPPAATEVLRAASVLAIPRLQALSAATGVDALTALTPAVRMGLVRIDADRVAFTHPLYASVVYSDVPPHERGMLHRRLADVVDDLEERAWHMALAADTSDAGIAGLLEAAADRAATRGAPATAAELMGLSAARTPPNATPDLHRRRLRTVECFVAAGAPRHARRLVRELMSAARPGQESAEALKWLGLTAGDWTVAIRAYERALSEPGIGAELEGELEHQLGFVKAYAGDLESARTHLLRATELLARSESAMGLEAVAGHVLLETFAAQVVDERVLDEAVARERRLGDAPRFRSPLKVAGIRSLYLGRADRAQQLLDEFSARVTDFGDDSLQVNVLAHFVALECLAGRIDPARDRLAELVPLAEQTAQSAARHYPTALLAAYEGRGEDAIQAARSMSEAASRRGDAFEVLIADSILGFVELSRGDAVSAWSVLQGLPARAEAMGYRLIGWLPPLYANVAEAALGAGETGRAQELGEILDRRARKVGSSIDLIGARRVRGLVAGAAGEYVAASEAFEQALDEEARARSPMERGRVLLARGAVQRRMKRWADARRSLEEAAAGFEQISSRLWLERSREELARVPGRRRGGDALTATEERVADLVASGLTNKEVAAALFVTVKAVEAHLSRVFAKLGVRSRSELARTLAQGKDSKL